MLSEELNHGSQVPNIKIFEDETSVEGPVSTEKVSEANITPPKSKTKCSFGDWWVDTISHVEHFLDRLFQAWGLYVAHHPCIVIILSTMVSIMGAYYARTLPLETDQLNLYAPSGTKSMEYYQKYKDTWRSISGTATSSGSKSRTLSMIFTSGDENVWTESVMYVLLGIHNQISNETFSAGTENDDLVFSDVCFDIDGTSQNDNNENNDNNEYPHCAISCVLEYFNFNRTIINQTFAAHNELLMESNVTNSSDSDDSGDSGNSWTSLNGTNSATVNITINDDDEINSDRVVTCPASFSKYTERNEILYERIGYPYSCVNISDDEIDEIFGNSSNEEYDEFNEEYSSENENEDELFESGILNSTKAYICKYETNDDYPRSMLDAFDLTIIDLFYQLNKKYDKHNSPYRISYSSTKSLTWEVERVSSIEANAPNFGASATILVLFSAFAVLKCKSREKVKKNGKHNKDKKQAKKKQEKDASSTSSSSCCCGCCSIDCKRSHTRVSVCGIISTVMAIITSFGLVGGLWQVPFNAFVAAVPLLLIGIGGM